MLENHDKEQRMGQVTEQLQTPPTTSRPGSFNAVLAVGEGASLSSLVRVN
jgi:hypothetical protein